VITLPVAYFILAGVFILSLSLCASAKGTDIPRTYLILEYSRPPFVGQAPLKVQDVLTCRVLRPENQSVTAQYPEQGQTADSFKNS
jgi:hypothetical protein